MVDFPRSNTLEIELTSKCTLSCPKCPRVLQVNDRDFWDNGGVNADHLINAIDSNIKHVMFGGSFGDGIYHPDVARVLKSLNDKDITYSFDTNGSYVKEQTWHDIANAIGPKDRFVFSIDGPPNNFTTYRVNSDWDSIERGIKILTSKFKRVRWKYIVFKYNSSYEDIKSAYDKAWELDIGQFMLVHTKRTETGQYVEVSEFSENLDRLESYVETLIKNQNSNKSKPPKLLINIHPRVRKISNESIVSDSIKKTTIKNDPVSFQKSSYVNMEITKKEYYETENVYPQCMNVQNWAQFIGSEGIYYPCCYTKTEKRNLIKDAGLNSDDLESMSIYNHTIDEIVKGSGYQKIVQNFDNISICRTKCSKKSK